MKPGIKPTAVTGFSLVEVMVAIGVLAVALTSVVALLPAGMRQVRRASEESRALEFLQAIAGDLSVAHTTNATQSPRFGLNFNDQTISLQLSADGEKTTESGAARYRIEGGVQGVAADPGPPRVHLRAVWPVQAQPGREEGSVEILSPIGS